MDPCDAGGGSIRTERTSPWLLITTPVATRRVPGGASGAVYSSATTDSLALAIAAAICRSSRSKAANNAASASLLVSATHCVGSPGSGRRRHPAPPMPIRTELRERAGPPRRAMAASAKKHPTVTQTMDRLRPEISLEENFMCLLESLTSRIVHNRVRLAGTMNLAFLVHVAANTPMGGDDRNTASIHGLGFARVARHGSPMLEIESEPRVWRRFGCRHGVDSRCGGFRGTWGFSLGQLGCGNVVLVTVRGFQWKLAHQSPRARGQDQPAAWNWRESWTERFSIAVARPRFRSA